MTKIYSNLGKTVNLYSQEAHYAKQSKLNKTKYPLQDTSLFKLKNKEKSLENWKMQTLHIEDGLCAVFWYTNYTSTGGKKKIEERARDMVYICKRLLYF